jgi:hypothetical protein
MMMPLRLMSPVADTNATGVNVAGAEITAGRTTVAERL